jgi:HAD superfamily hydrolase (TIGR01509 family)
MNKNLLYIIDKYDLFIFDLDDTIFMTERIHNKAWNITLSHYLKKEYSLDFKEYCNIFHSNKSINFISEYLENDLKLNNQLEIREYKNNIYFDLIKENNVNLNEGVEEFINLIIKNNKKFVIVTNTGKDNVDIFINKYDFMKKCDKIYTREMFVNKKPHPECYLKICKDYREYKKIGFEDSLTGVHALNQVDEIDGYFVNNKDYYHFEYIINNYKDIKWINNFNYFLVNNI